MTSWFYRDIVSEDGTHVYVVGFYDPTGKWNPESDFDTADEASERVHYLNGGRLLPKKTQAELGGYIEEDDDPDKIPF